MQMIMIIKVVCAIVKLKMLFSKREGGRVGEVTRSRPFFVHLQISDTVTMGHLLDDVIVRTSTYTKYHHFLKIRLLG